MLRSNISQQNWYRWSVAFPIPSHRPDIYSVQLRPNRLRLRWRQSTTYTYQLQTDITRMRSAQAYQPQVQPKAQTRRFATLTLVNFAQQSSEAIRISRRWIRNHTNAFPAFLLASSILPLNCNATGNANIGVCTLTTTPHASRAHTIQVHLHPAHHLVVGTGNIRRSAHRFVGAHVLLQPTRCCAESTVIDVERWTITKNPHPRLPARAVTVWAFWKIFAFDSVCPKVATATRPRHGWKTGSGWSVQFCIAATAAAVRSRGSIEFNTPKEGIILLRKGKQTMPLPVHVQQYREQYRSWAKSKSTSTATAARNGSEAPSSSWSSAMLTCSDSTAARWNFRVNDLWFPPTRLRRCPEWDRSKCMCVYVCVCLWGYTANHRRLLATFNPLTLWI